MKKRTIIMGSLILLSIMNPGISNAPAQQGPLRPAVKAPEIAIGEAKKQIPDWLARWELARVLSYSKKYEESLREYRLVIKEKPDLTEARVEMANILYLLNKPEEALRELERPEQGRLPDSARLLLAEVYAQTKQYARAEALYRSHLEKRPQDDQIRLKLAEILSWEKKYKDSLAEYERLLQGHPQDSQLRRKYAFVLSWSGRHHDAARELRKTLGE